MAKNLQEQYDNTNMSNEVLVKTAQAYATVCTAITQGYQHWQEAIAEDEIFLQIGNKIVRKSDIIRVEIFDPNKIYDYKHIKNYTRDFYGGDNFGSESNYILHRYDSLEASQLLEWLKGKTETLKEKSKCCDEPIEE